MGTGGQRPSSTDSTGRRLPDGAEWDDGAAAKRRVVVDLQDGFADDTVQITCGDAASWTGDGVTTDAMLGLAESAELTVPAGDVVLAVSVATRDIEGAMPLPNQPGTFVGVSISGAGVDFVVLGEPFGYA